MTIARGKLRGQAKQEFLDRMAKGRHKAALNRTRKITRKITPKRKVTRKKSNPVKALDGIKRKINQSIRLYKRFTGMEPKFLDNHSVNVPEVGMVIGKCDGVLYTTRRDNKTEKYIHKFKGRSRPLLCSSWDGKQLFFVDGSYNFTADGIIDK